MQRMNDLNENTEYIEAYFKDQLNDAEKRQFEQRCLEDELFARQVAVFVTAEEGIRQELLQQKQQEWAGISQKPAIRPLKKIISIRLLPYMAAACLVIAIASYFFFRSETPNQLANTYIKEHFTLLSQTMNASNDTLQKGIAAYNNKEYNTALQLFQKVYQSNPANSKAKKNIGLVYLATKEYEKALQQFEELAGTPGLYENPGLFLMAVTLLERNKTGDLAKAKALLQQVVQQKTEGSKEAARWLKEWR